MGKTFWRRWPTRPVRAAALALMVGAVGIAGETQVARADTPSKATGDDVVAESDDVRALMAPVALYPDPILALVLQALTLPLQVVQADRFLDKRSKDANLQPDPNWDKSIIALLNYPRQVQSMWRGWPMPVPLVKGPSGWTFDVKEGLQEITDRRVGRNELSAIEFCKAYIDAQRRYASADHDNDGVLEFAQRLKSSQQDGLYWKAGADGVISPLGPLVASAEQYLQHRQAGEPFHGYYFRILTGQGANAAGGKYSYVINGNMIAGFAMIAWPADYRRSGIMTFQCGHNRQILEKDLGPETGKLATAITTFDPDKSWNEVTD